MERSRELIIRSLAAGPRTMWDLVLDQDSQHHVFTKALGAVCSDGLVASAPNGLLRLTERGWAIARRERLADWRDHTCPNCQGRGLVADGEMAALQERFRRLSAGRPAITTEFDQGVVPAEVAFARVALLEQRGDLAGKDILILGDDDLMSVAFSLRGLSNRILVLEVDTRITCFLRKIVSQERWDGVEIVDYDVRQPFPLPFHHKFDVFFTDPVETVDGIALYLSRCVQGLRGEGGTGYFGLTNLESGWPKWLGVQRAVLGMNLVVTEVLRDFNKYSFLGEEVLRSQMKIVRQAPVPLPPPDRLWFSSSIFRLQAVGDPQPLFTDAVDWDRQLYVDGDTI